MSEPAFVRIPSNEIAGAVVSHSVSFFPGMTFISFKTGCERVRRPLSDCPVVGHLQGLMVSYSEVLEV